MEPKTLIGKVNAKFTVINNIIVRTLLKSSNVIALSNKTSTLK